MNMTFHALDGFQTRALHRQKMMVNGLIMLANDFKARARQQMMYVGDTPRHRVIDRNHGELSLAHMDGIDGVLKRRAW